MADQNEYKPPKLHFVNGKGEYVPEYLPTANFKFMDWFRWKYIKVRSYFGKDIYYWHLRHNLDPVDRKTADIEFVHHVVLAHDQNPEDPVERRHFKRAWKLYGHEMKYVLEEIGKDKDTEWENAEIRNGHPYAYAYTKQWFEKFPEVESKLMYHGISMSQYLALLDILRARALKRRDEYCQQHGLDPETGEKLDKKTKKKTRHARKTDRSLAKAKKSKTT